MELRTQATPIKTEGNRLVGRAIVYDSPTKITTNDGHFVETIKRDAVANKDGNIKAFLDHDRTELLGMTAANTLRVNYGPDGVDYDLDIPNWIKPKVVEQMQRNELQGSSFGFKVLKDNWSMRDGVAHREISSLELDHLSPVYSPAYLQSSVQLRSIDFPQPTMSLKDCELRLKKIDPQA